MSRTMEAMMEKQGHTPGPWTLASSMAGELGINRRRIFTIHGPARPYRGKPYSDHIATADHDWNTFEEYEANARLIAAAPDLLAALKLARAYMDVCLGAPEWDGKNPYPVIDAALAKATGERA